MSISRTEDVKFYEDLLNKLSKSTHSSLVYGADFDKSDLVKKIGIVRHLLQKLKSEDKHFRDSAHVAHLKQIYFMNLELQSIELEKKRKEERNAINAHVDAVSHLPKPLSIQLAPNVALEKICEEYVLFVADLLELKNEDDEPLYNESDFAYIPVGVNQPRPVFKFPNEELEELFFQILVMKGMVKLNEQDKAANIKYGLSLTIELLIQATDREHESSISPFKMNPSPYR